MRYKRKIIFKDELVDSKNNENNNENNNNNEKSVSNIFIDRLYNKLINPEMTGILGIFGTDSTAVIRNAVSSKIIKENSIILEGIYIIKGDNEDDIYYEFMMCILKYINSILHEEINIHNRGSYMYILLVIQEYLKEFDSCRTVTTFYSIEEIINRLNSLKDVVKKYILVIEISKDAFDRENLYRILNLNSENIIIIVKARFNLKETYYGFFDKEDVFIC